MNRSIRLTALFAGLVGIAAVSPAHAADDAMGFVTAVKGSATAQQPGEEARALKCGDEVFADDKLVTADASLLSMLSGDILTHMDAKTTLGLDVTADAKPDMVLRAGKVRVIDPRDDGAAGRLTVLDATAQIASTDTEAYLFAEKAGGYAMLCEWDAPLSVNRKKERAVASPGKCVISKKTEPLYTANAHLHRIPALAAEVCEIDPGLLAALAGNPLDHLSPMDVAAPGPVPGVGMAGLAQLSSTLGILPVRAACDSPGACGLPAATIVVEPAPGVGGVPLF
jgi:hypothetical protein